MNHLGRDQGRSKIFNYIEKDRLRLRNKKFLPLLRVVQDYLALLEVQHYPEMQQIMAHESYFAAYVQTTNKHDLRSGWLERWEQAIFHDTITNVDNFIQTNKKNHL